MMSVDWRKRAGPEKVLRGLDRILDRRQQERNR